MKNTKILCIDDCELIRSMIKDCLEKDNFTVFTAADRQQAHRAIQQHAPDLILLDFMLEETDGITLMREFHDQNIHTPIIMVSGRGDDVDRIIGLEAGADDYIAKPFQPRELTARVKAVLKRSQTHMPASSTPQHSALIGFGKWTLDTRQYQAFDDQQRSADLTTAEFLILEKLTSAPNQAFSREQLMNSLNGQEIEAFDRTIDIKITRIRKKLGDSMKNPQYIKTIRSVGYMFIGKIEHKPENN